MTLASSSGSLLRLGSWRGRVALLATVLASSTAMLDSTVANVALPHIGDELDAGVTGLQWVITGYLLTLASLILVGGALGDRFGRKRTFLLGAAWFALASLGCALAPTLPLLVVARMMQGVGGALLTPASLALTQASFDPEDRGAAVGAWAGMGGLAIAVGPLVGAWLVDGLGWRWAFLLNLPLLAAVGVAALAIPETGRTRERTSFDLAGAVLGVATLGAATWALTQGPELGWGAPSVIASALGAVASAAVFVWLEHRKANPMVPGELFRSRTFTVLNIATFALYAMLGAQLFLVVYQLQVTTGWSATLATTALIPTTLLMVAGSAWSGAISARIGPKPQMVIGPLLAAIGVVLLAGIDDGTSWWIDVLPGATILGLGLVTFVAPLTASVLAAVEESRVGTASGINNAVARTGSLVAVALIPGVAGLASASGNDAVTDAYRLGMLLTAALGLAAALVSATALPRHVELPTDRSH